MEGDVEKGEQVAVRSHCLDQLLTRGDEPSPLARQSPGGVIDTFHFTI